MSNAARGETYVATGEITALKHELRDHAMELGAGVTKALLTSAESTEVLGGLGDNIVIEIKVDAAALFCPIVSTRPMARDDWSECDGWN